MNKIPARIVNINWDCGLWIFQWGGKHTYKETVQLIINRNIPLISYKKVGFAYKLNNFAQCRD